MTAKEIIKALPMDETLKIQILNLYDFMEPSEKHRVDRIAWNTYHEFFQLQLDENLQLQFSDAMHGKGDFGNEFYANALKKTEQDMGKDLQASLEKYDLAAARKAMEHIINEIQAAKKPQKKKPK